MEIHKTWTSMATLEALLGMSAGNNLKATELIFIDFYTRKFLSASKQSTFD
jgi:hypothetical protein